MTLSQQIKSALWTRSSLTVLVPDCKHEYSYSNILYLCVPEIWRQKTRSLCWSRVPSRSSCCVRTSPSVWRTCPGAAEDPTSNTASMMLQRVGCISHHASVKRMNRRISAKTLKQHIWALCTHECTRTHVRDLAYWSHILFNTHTDTRPLPRVPNPLKVSMKATKTITASIKRACAHTRKERKSVQVTRITTYTMAFYAPLHITMRFLTSGIYGSNKAATNTHTVLVPPNMLGRK